MKTGKEIKLNSPDNYSVVLGTIDNKTPKTLYFQISSWGLPKTEYENYEQILRKKSRKVKSFLYEKLSDEKFYKDKTIVDFNMASSGISKGKRSYMCVDVTLYKKSPYIPINEYEMINEIGALSKDLINSIFESDDDFVFYGKKK
jgi:hypothetical protein